MSPVWGRHREVFAGALESHAKALESYAGHVKYICHTDNHEEIYEAVWSKTGFKPVCLPLFDGLSGYAQFAACCRHAVEITKPGETIVFLGADVLVSTETFCAIDKRVREGKKAVVSHGIRTLTDKLPEPMSGQDLLNWALEHRHPIVRELFWPEGRSMIPSFLFFEKDDTVVARGFHLGPIAIVKDRNLTWKSTTDDDLIVNYLPHEIHVVTDAEFALAEVSPIEKTFPCSKHPFEEKDIVDWAKRKANKRHRWFFTHHLKIRGDNDLDYEVAGRILNGLR